MSLHYSYGGYTEEIICYWIGLAKIKYRFQGTSVTKEGLLFANNSSLNSSTENGEEELFALPKLDIQVLTVVLDPC